MLEPREPRVDDADDPWALVSTPTGREWSGRTRYAAAMHFYAVGEMESETLEVYRICSRLDDEDPLDVLRRWRIGSDWIRKYEQAVGGRRR